MVKISGIETIKISNNNKVMICPIGFFILLHASSAIGTSIMSSYNVKRINKKITFLLLKILINAAPKLSSAKKHNNILTD